ncbi:hypothetical protein [Poritiphilus flavus]|uniref:Uncharacterized protein n=1 Tax=Poritiphilus flavus TaxID=2697053 RepID=A0A6L9EHE5_9FLAO|nr:hypothetical protein [Poritiphilus flavus]NAS14131.1 hypothetical protein [Poritiphilus flavus]
MRKSITILIVILALSYSCKQEKAKKPVSETPEPTVLERIANAYGYQDWNKVSELRFTFNVDRDTAHFERKWIWKPQQNEVTGISLGDTITFNRNALDSTAMKADAAFINDKFWLLVPFNLVWDADGFTYEHQETATAPISKENSQKLTIVYNSEGGYTPGDAYDLYFGDDHRITEWVFRKGNQPDPSMTTTWEDNVEMNGILISKMHQKAPEDEDFKLYFSGVEVKTAN